MPTAKGTVVCSTLSDSSATLSVQCPGVPSYALTHQAAKSATVDAGAHGASTFTPRIITLTSTQKNTTMMMNRPLLLRSFNDESKALLAAAAAQAQLDIAREQQLLDPRGIKTRQAPRAVMPGGFGLAKLLTHQFPRTSVLDMIKELVS